MTEQAALRRWLLTDGAPGVGAMPDWFPLIRAARYLGVAPWELQEQAAAWQNWAIIAENAENEALKAKQKQQEGGS